MRSGVYPQRREAPLGVSFFESRLALELGLVRKAKPVNKHETHLQIGVITRPHGVRGELKIKLHNEESLALREAGEVVVETPDGKATRRVIESVRGNVRGLILALVGVEGREGAEALRGSKVWVERSALPPLEPGEYYLVDLVGCEVYLEEKLFATVESVRPDPSVDTLVLVLEDGTRREQPIVDAWVGAVDIDRRRIELLSTDGLIES